MSSPATRQMSVTRLSSPYSLWSWRCCRSVGDQRGPTRHTGDVTDDQHDPAAILRRIAYLLERRHEETYRVRAYRTAAASAEAAGLDDLRNRHVAGTLTDLPGIGKKTASIITDVLNSRLPDYLVELEETAGGSVTSGGATMRAALRGDLHAHSDWSD